MKMPKILSQKDKDFLTDVAKARQILIECLELNNIYDLAGLTAMQGICCMLISLTFRERDKFIDYLNDKHLADLKAYDDMYKDGGFLQAMKEFQEKHFMDTP